MSTTFSIQPPTPAPRHRPNIVFVLADRWRAQAAGYAGDPIIKTPRLDALAAPIKGVTVDGKPWNDNNNTKETITVKGLTGTVAVAAHY